MFHRTRKHLTPSTFIALLALVLALTGGAFAATGQSGSSTRATTAKVKPRAKPGPRGPVGPRGATGATGAPGATGPTGPTGALGAVGPQGPKGDTGAAGANGHDGANGASVVSAALAPGEDGCIEGGSKFTVGGNETTACNGEKGEAAVGGGGGYPKTLPAGETETGSFVAYFEHNKGVTFTAISFPIRLPLELGSSAVHYVTTAEQEGHTAPSECAGSAEKPTAVKGNLCVYEGFHAEAEPPAVISELTVTTIAKPVADSEGVIGAGTTGALLRVSYEGTDEEGVFLGGDWAVNAQ
jgi:Collagen triple helix repeat (20 copies)